MPEMLSPNKTPPVRKTLVNLIFINTLVFVTGIVMLGIVILDLIIPHPFSIKDSSAEIIICHFLTLCGPILMAIGFWGLISDFVEAFFLKLWEIIKNFFKAVFRQK